MRLYLKLFAMLLLAGAAEFSFEHTDNDGCTLWFALRCHYAHVSGDGAMAERLVDEQYERRLASRGVDYRMQLRLAQLAAEADMRAAGDESATLDRATSGPAEDHRGIAQIEHDREVDFELESLCSAVR